MNRVSSSPILSLISTVIYERGDGLCRLARPARRLLPARIAIHPADMKYALLRGEIAALLDWGAGDFVEPGAALLS